MNTKIILSFVLALLLVIGQSDAQGRRRGNKNKKDLCHLREAEACMNDLQKLGKAKDPTSIIASSKGLDKLCSTIKEDTIKCVKTYSKKCGTPLHRELLDLVLDQITSRMNKFCKGDNKDRTEFLKESPCIHKKVLSTEEYKKGCNNNFLAVVDQMDDEVTAKADDGHARMCCGYLTWQKCTDSLVKDKCGDNAIKQYQNFMGGLTGTITNMACPKDLFPVDGKECKKLLPVPGTKSKGKLGDNAMTKYVTSLFSFMFIVDE